MKGIWAIVRIVLKEKLWTSDDRNNTKNVRADKSLYGNIGTETQLLYVICICTSNWDEFQIESILAMSFSSIEWIDLSPFKRLRQKILWDASNGFSYSIVSELPSLIQFFLNWVRCQCILWKTKDTSDEIGENISPLLSTRLGVKSVRLMYKIRASDYTYAFDLHKCFTVAHTTSALSHLANGFRHYFPTPSSP